jgi:hypothetical protein
MVRVVYIGSIALFVMATLSSAGCGSARSQTFVEELPQPPSPPAETPPAPDPLPAPQHPVPKPAAVIPTNIEWTPLFNGHNLEGWTPWLSSADGQGPAGMFKVEEDGSLHLLDLEDTEQTPPFGYLYSNKTYSSYWLRLEQRWGTKRFKPRQDGPRDSGVMYHLNGEHKIWPTCAEFQVQENDTGDLWLLNQVEGQTRFRILEGKSTYAEDASLATWLSNLEMNRASAQDKLTDWNKLELIVDGPNAVHVLNGAVANRVWNLKRSDGAPLASGHLALQAEGAEVFYRNVEIRPLVYTPAPPEAVVLFDGEDTDAWHGPGGGAATWPVNAQGAMEICDGCGNIRTRQAFGDFRLHVEFWVPWTPSETAEQGRGNSGIYLQSRYEIQVLDSYAHPLEGADDAGAIYGVKNADSHEALPSQVWQTYDIFFRAARWDESGNKLEDARVTVLWNGRRVHDNVAIPNSTLLGEPEAPEPAPLLLQDHGSPVRYRNIWIVPEEDSE